VKVVLADRLLGHVPDAVVRRVVRVNCARRLARERRGGPARRHAFLTELRRQAIAEHVETANEQHYEVPTDLFRLALGPRLKYSCCYWPRGVGSLADAEEAMLELTCERAQVEDGMEILDLGCGWGSLTFWLAERYPAARILAVSNSRSQREMIASEARRRGATGVEVVTADVNEFDPRRSFDRILSIEMLEHVHNYPELLRRVSSWLEPDGRFFAHVFSHRAFAYRYESGWIARNYFTGGTMPSHALLPSVADGLRLERDWVLDGRHYARTAEAWLERLDARRDEALAVLAAHYGADAASHRLQMWRVFFLAVAETWGYRGGTEWGVSQYRFASDRSAID
jgi:cyclopropane-fatty-acyl-phospholipid synthase